MALGWDDAALAAIMIGDYVYHRLNDEPPKAAPARELSLPRTDDGSPYPVLYGRVRVKSPIIAWCDKPISMTAGDFGGITGVADTTVLYMLSMYLILGIPFEGGDQTLLAMWVGDSLLVEDTSGIGSAVALSTLTGTSSDYDITHMREGHVGQALLVNDPLSGWTNTGAVEFRNGNASQVLCDVPFGGESHVGTHMAVSSTGSGAWNSLYGNIAAEDIPGYRGFLSVFLYGYESLSHWLVGASPSVPAYSFEIQSLPTTFLGPANYVPVHEGDITRAAGDANPMDVLYDLLTGSRGKLGLDPGVIGPSGIASFQAAATTLYNEGIGYANSFEGGKTAREIIDEIMRQIDGVIYEDPSDGNVKVKLIRNDYDPGSLRVITVGSGAEITNFAAGGWSDIPNKIRISFPDRARGYNDNSGVAFNEANALGQDGQTREIQIRMDGVRELATANAIAARELAARSRPLIKCRALVDRTFRTICPGDCVVLNWPEWQISNAVMRVAAVNRGTLEDGRIALDLIQDYYYVWRSRPPVIVADPVITLGPPRSLP